MYSQGYTAGITLTLGTALIWSGWVHDRKPEQMYSPEIQLLLCCARTVVPSNQRDQIEALASGSMDWSALIQMAGQHGVLPLLYQNLKTHAHATVPVLGQLRQYGQTIAISNTLFARALLNVLQLLETHGIRALPFKGPVLAVSVYGNLGLRHFCDLDIWVEPQRAQDAIALLTDKVGYRAGRQWRFLNPAQEAAFRASWREYSLFKGTIAIDLHRSLTVEKFLSVAFDFEHLWAQRTAISLAGQSVPSFGRIELLIYLCLHGSKECWRGLKWICDVAEWMHNYSDVDWDQVMARAQDLRCQRRLLLGVSLAHEVLGSPLPDRVAQQQAEDSTSQDLVQQFKQHLFMPNTPLGRSFTWQKFWLHVRSVDQAQDRWASLEELKRQVDAIAIKGFPNSRDYAFLPLPQHLHLLYYFLRPVRLLQQKKLLRSRQR